MQPSDLTAPADPSSEPLERLPHTTLAVFLGASHANRSTPVTCQISGRDLLRRALTKISVPPRRRASLTLFMLGRRALA